MGCYPGHTRVAELHVTRPAFHGDNGEFALAAGLGLLADDALLVEEDGQLARGETVDIGDGIFAHKREITRFHEVALDFIAAQRIGTVENHELGAILSAGLHAHAHRGIERVAAASHVLDVIDQHVDVLESAGQQRHPRHRQHGHCRARRARDRTTQRAARQAPREGCRRCS